MKWNINRQGRAAGRHNGGFTLIELMVVIAIIAVLASLSVPVIGRALESARRAQANTEVAALHSAVRAYYNEYSRFPHQGDGTAEYIDGNSRLLNVLRARDGTGNSGHANNRRRIVFLEVTDRSLSDDEANPDFVDPWGRPYRVMVDIDFEGAITPRDHDEAEVLVAAWSLGEEPENVERHITSWK